MIDANPMRVHLAMTQPNLTIRAACNKPGAWRLSDDEAKVTCAACRRILSARVHPSRGGA